MVTKTRGKAKEVEDGRDIREEALAVAEQQLAVDRALALDRISQLGEHIRARSKSGVARALADLMWLNHRIDQVDGMATPLWCHVCADPPEYPGSTWMIWECLEHAEPQLARSAKNWEQNLFGGVL